MRRKSDGAHAEVIDAENHIVRFGIAASGPLGERKVAPIDPDDFEFVGMRHGDVDYTKPRTAEEMLRGSSFSETFAGIKRNSELEELRAENKRLRALYEALLHSRSVGTKIAFSMVDDAQKRLHDAKRRFRKTRRAR